MARSVLTPFLRPARALLALMVRHAGGSSASPPPRFPRSPCAGRLGPCSLSLSIPAVQMRWRTLVRVVPVWKGSWEVVGVIYQIAKPVAAHTERTRARALLRI